MDYTVDLFLTHPTRRGIFTSNSNYVFPSFICTFFFIRFLNFLNVPIAALSHLYFNIHSFTPDLLHFLNFLPICFSTFSLNHSFFSPKTKIINALTHNSSQFLMKHLLNTYISYSNHIFQDIYGLSERKLPQFPPPSLL